MKTLTCSILSLAVVALLALSGPADAAAPASYCSPSGDFCQWVGGTKKRPIFFLRTFSLRGDIDVCVDPPSSDQWECHSFPLRRGKHGVFTSKVRWHKHFEDAGAGSYRVKWQQDDARIGRALSFRVK